MCAGVSSAFSRRRALKSGEGRHCAYSCRTSPGISISRSWLTSCMIRPIGNSGARSSGPSGFSVPGCSGGAIGLGRSAAMLYQARGMRFCGRLYWMVSIPNSINNKGWVCTPILFSSSVFRCDYCGARRSAGLLPRRDDIAGRKVALTPACEGSASSFNVRFGFKVGFDFKVRSDEDRFGGQFGMDTFVDRIRFGEAGDACHPHVENAARVQGCVGNRLTGFFGSLHADVRYVFTFGTVHDVEFSTGHAVLVKFAVDVPSA